MLLLLLSKVTQCGVESVCDIVSCSSGTTGRVVVCAAMKPLHALGAGQSLGVAHSWLLSRPRCFQLLGLMQVLQAEKSQLPRVRNWVSSGTHWTWRALPYCEHSRMRKWPLRLFSILSGAILCPICTSCWSGDPFSPGATCTVCGHILGGNVNNI